MTGATEQVVIALCGVAAVFASQAREARVRRWACIFGMAAQPFWIGATWRAEQWGMLALSIVYAGAWAFGIYNFWVRRH